MLSELQKIADKLGLGFSYGGRGTFNFSFDEATQFPFWYSEGFADSSWQIDKMQKLTETFSFSFWLFMEQDFDAEIKMNSEQIEQMRMIAKKISLILAKAGIVSRVDFVGVSRVPLTDKSVDGVNFKMNYTPTVQAQICL